MSLALFSKYYLMMYLNALTSFTNLTISKLCLSLLLLSFNSFLSFYCLLEQLKFINSKKLWKKLIFILLIFYSSMFGMFFSTNIELSFVLALKNFWAEDISKSWLEIGPIKVPRIKMRISLIPPISPSRSIIPYTYLFVSTYYSESEWNDLKTTSCSS